MIPRTTIIDDCRRLGLVNYTFNLSFPTMESRRWAFWRDALRAAASQRDNAHDNLCRAHARGGACYDMARLRQIADLAERIYWVVDSKARTFSAFTKRPPVS